MMQKIHLYLTIVLLSSVCINGLTGDAHYVELAVVKASKIPMKIKPNFINKDDNRKYAMSQMALPYIKDAKIRKHMAGATWCGTPTMTYVLKNGRPSENELRMEATLIEAQYRK
jgi:hypothetical protein